MAAEITRHQLYRDCITQGRLLLLIKLDWRLTVIDFDRYFRRAHSIAQMRNLLWRIEAQRRKEPPRA